MTAEDWRERIVELRELAANTPDPSRRQRYLDLANRWDQFIKELESPAIDVRYPGEFGLFSAVRSI